MNIIEFENDKLIYGFVTNKIRNYTYEKHFSEDYPYPMIEIHFTDGQSKFYAGEVAIAIREALRTCG